MRRVLCLLACACWLGCAAKDAPLPPVPSPPEDLSQWVVPELVQPPRDDVGQPPAKERPATKEEQLVEYLPGVSTKVLVPMDGPLDIQLQVGERVHNIVGGDAGAPGDAAPSPDEAAPAPAPKKMRWEQVEGTHGAGETQHNHVFFHAKEPNLTMGVVITTDRRVYYLTAKSVRTSPVRVVRWKYAPDTLQALAPKEPGLLPEPGEKKMWHVGYTLTSSQKQAPDWMPRYVLDDGRKVYLVLPEITLFAVAPMVRMIGPNGPQLVNVHNYLNVIIVDQLAPRLELRVGIGDTAEIVTITRGHLRTIQCGTPQDSDAACPVWPAAAQALARRARP